MGKFLTHEAIATGYFCPQTPCGNATQVAWAKELMSTPEAVALLLDRMEKDWVATPPKLRKPWTGVHVEP